MGQPIDEPASAPHPQKKMGCCSIIFLAVLGFVAYVNLTESPERKAQREAEREQERMEEQREAEAERILRPKINSRVMARAKEIGEGKFTLEVGEEKSRLYSYSIYYDEEVFSINSVRSDCSEVIRECLKALMDNGVKPTEENITVFSWAYRRVKGETGTDRFIVYGRSMYNHNKDSIEFTED